MFGLLFASADALFAEWVDALVPDLGSTRSCSARSSRSPSAAWCSRRRTSPSTRRGSSRPRGPTGPVAHRFEWLAPVLVVDAVFVVFLVAQATVIFGGHDYLERTTGLTYAEYVHQGFGQLTVATALTLLVVWAAARKAPRDDRRRPHLDPRLARPAVRR